MGHLDVLFYPMALQRKILVPLGRSFKALKSVHHALALAKRIGAQIVILQQAVGEGADARSFTYVSETLSVISSKPDTTSSSVSTIA